MINCDHQRGSSGVSQVIKGDIQGVSGGPKGGVRGVLGVQR